MASYTKRDKKKKEKSDDELFTCWMEDLKKIQESDLDQREQANESDEFLLDKDGQWEDHIAQQLDSLKKPRYTFDKVTPVIESMMSDIEDMDFGCNVKPANGEAQKEVALTLEGMIRGIQNHSRSDSTFRNACRRIIRRGFDAWMVRAGYLDEWQFDQDLIIKPISNAVNRVWLGPHEEQDGSDAKKAYILTSLSPDEYWEKFPDGSGVSVDDAQIDRNYDNYQPEVITIGERYYQKDKEIEVAQMSNGAVYEMDDDFKKVEDELKQSGVTVAKTKKIRDFTWCHRAFDGGKILTEERETVFKSNPIVVVYGNFEKTGQSSKITYSGIVLKEMDAQRVHNYAKSRKIEEGALRPRDKLMMTKKQAKGHGDQIARMNISTDPVQFYNPDPEAPQPYYASAPPSNPGLDALGQEMAIDIKEQASVFSAMQGDFAGRMSEDTVKMQIDRGTASTRKWVNALIVGIRRTCEILVETIPSVYDTKRQFALVDIDGTESMVDLNDEVYDQQTNKMIKVNDLSRGRYKVVCDAGPAFANKLEAGLDALLEYAKIDPTVIAQGGDVMLKAIDAPLVDKIAERKRAQMIQQGMIPVDQMTEEEKEKAMAQMQANAAQQQPDAAMVMAQAEMMKAQADMLQQQNDQAKLQLEVAKLQQAGVKIQLDSQKQAADIGKTKADTIQSMAKAEQISTQTVGQQIQNLEAVTPKVTIIGSTQ